MNAGKLSSGTAHSPQYRKTVVVSSRLRDAHIGLETGVGKRGAVKTKWELGRGGGGGGGGGESEKDRVRERLRQTGIV